MNILSLFDGISCGQIALNRANIKYNKYFASEIDKHAIKITQKNYPNTIQLGDVRNWKEWNLPKINLLLAGSPCQGFSLAGKQLNFNDPRSELFFEFVKILNYIKPRYFLLENVRMKRQWEDIISTQVKKFPIKINSNLVSAQNRLRNYWTNISDYISQPKDKKIFLKDIIETGIFQNFHKQIVFIKQLPRGTNKGGYKAKNGKMPSLTSSSCQYNNLLVIKNKSNSIRTSGRNSKDRHEWDNIFKNSNLITGGAKRTRDRKGKIFEIRKNGKGNSLTTVRTDSLVVSGDYFRILTPLECERLQTIPDNYTSGISNTQRYKCLGNAWTVDVIVHILNYIKHDYGKTKLIDFLKS